MGEYVKLATDVMQTKIDTLLMLWEKFLQATISAVYKNDKQKLLLFEQHDRTELCSINTFLLREVFERTHQREDYFDRYHQLDMSNYKEIGLIAFWLVKFKPFHLNFEYFDEYYDSKINEEFALYFIFNTVARYIKEDKDGYSLEKISPKLYNELLYTMQYRDISKEAYGCLVELIKISTYIDLHNTSCETDKNNEDTKG